MSYKLIFDNKVIEYLQMLNIDIKKRVFNKLLLSKDNPQHYFTKLKGRDDYKLRVGKYRIIADINNTSKTIMVTHISLRKNIYK